MSNDIKFSEEQKEKMMSAIKNYFLDEREEELGDLASGRVLNFFIEELAPEIYNQGVVDAYYYMNNKLEDVLGIQK